MAALQIDKSLIDSSALVQSDEVIAMQNGCLCCTLQSDLVEQIIKLAQRKTFDYMIIEASGVSEPAQIAPLFDDCEDDHDHDEAHAGASLSELARLDTCVTVVDAAEFNRNLASVAAGKGDSSFKGTFAELMVEQVEYSNVVLLNKRDLVTESQLAATLEQISVLNPKARIITSEQSKVDIQQILDTRSFSSADMANPFVFEVMKAEPTGVFQDKDCCRKSLEQGEIRCCRPDAGQCIDSGMSQLLLYEGSKSETTRHEARFGITSFVYRARRPFHPGRLFELWIDEFFVFMSSNSTDDEETSKPDNKDAANDNGEAIENDEKVNDKAEANDKEEPNDKDEASDKDEAMISWQKEATRKQNRRTKIVGELLRSKGFLWIATTHDIIGAFSCIIAIKVVIFSSCNVVFRGIQSSRKYRHCGR